MADWNPVAFSPFHARHLVLGAVMVESGGWRQPARYTTAEEEADRVGRGMGMADISPAGKLRAHGDDLDSYLANALEGEAGLAPGQVALREFTEDSAVGDVVEARLAADEALLITAPGQSHAVSRALDEVSQACAHRVDVTSALAGVAICGPLAHGLLSAVTEMDTSPAAFPDMTCAQGKVAEIHGTVLRRDLGGLLSYDLYFARDFSEYMWDALMEAGERYGVTPFGTEAMALLRSRRTA